MNNPEFVPENETQTFLWDFERQTDHQVPARRPDLRILKKKKKLRTCRIVDFVVLADYRMKIKEKEKKDRYFDHARKLKSERNMKVTEIPIVIGSLETIFNGLVKGLEDLEIGGQVETIQARVLLRSNRILRRVQET